MYIYIYVCIYRVGNLLFKGSANRADRTSISCFIVFSISKNRQPNWPILMYFLQKSSAQILNRQPMADGPTLISNPVYIYR